MSFSLDSLEQFALQLGDVVEGIRLMWLVDNPRVPYDADLLCEGETTFDYASEALPVFLERQGLTDRVRRLSCGLYMQYNPSLTPGCLRAVHDALRSLCERSGFLGLWSDRSLDPSMDSLEGLSVWLPEVDFLNSDLPESFFESSGAAPGAA